MDNVLPLIPVEPFFLPEKEDYSSLKPVLRGELGNPGEEPHSILYWINKDDPMGAPPVNPASDPQFTNWEYSVRLWFNSRTP